MANANAAENINVLVRFRPINEAEREHKAEESHVTYKPDGRTVELHDVFNASVFTFSYNRVFQPGSAQTDLYERVGPPVLDAVLNGINAAVIAYGQTSSGKTHTMYGEADGSQAGLVPRLLQALFARVAHPAPDEFFQASVSFIQIYRENIMDLLVPNVDHCLIREDQARGLWITDAVVQPVTSAEDALRIMATGDRRRVVAWTKANAHSSRSHTVFIVSIHKRCVFDNTECFAQLYLVDLAGSECVEKTGSEGQRLEEGKCINTSLLALRNVISALVHDKRHIPYRDSKITRLLQNSFGGNAKTFLVVCCSPSAYNQRETMASLRFADSSGRIQNRLVRNVRRSPEELSQLLDHALADITNTRNRILELRQILALQATELHVQDLETEEVPDHFLCPLTKRPMQQPVIAMDGFTYEEAALRAYLEQHRRTPLGVADVRYFPNHSLRREWEARRPEDIAPGPQRC